MLIVAVIEFTANKGPSQMRAFDLHILPAVSVEAKGKIMFAFFVWKLIWESQALDSVLIEEK